ncbi:MAG: HIT family protein [Candidatus Bathyarchaeota archaeon]|nr:HIT family protein [Candidatus Bathyarchaeota archaeon]MDH5747156.1 HIT family protein [Candidatus Bathyarchaeota archaeon]
MSEHCTFCEILKNEKTASYVYEDNRTIAILDIRPINEGHTLVIPKKHYENLYEIPDEEVAYLFKIVKKVASAVKKVTNADGKSIFQNNGRAAGQVIFHVHVHIIPRYEGQRSHRLRCDASREKLDEVARKIRNQLTLST